MYKLRIKFTKEGYIRFISHLDLVNLFVRATRRANIPVVYSNGFNPRPKIESSFALPLGIESLSEFADFLLSEKIDEGFFIESLSGQFPEGIKILECFYVPLNSSSLTSTLNLAKYEITLYLRDQTLTFALIKEKIDKFMNNQDKTVLHWTKKGKKETDISDIIKDIQCNLIGSAIIISILLRISSQKNIRPQEILVAILNVSEKDMFSWHFVRKELS